VTLSLDTGPAGTKVGQTVSVAVTTGTVDNAIYVNSAAITSVGSRHTVRVMTNGQATVTAVEVGLEGDTATQITSGLTAGQEVVINTASSTSGSNTGNFPGGGVGGLTGGGNFGGGGTNRGTGGGGR
jgi:macrolide-specific efflux system membrane fusion protein